MCLVSDFGRLAYITSTIIFPDRSEAGFEVFGTMPDSKDN